MRNWLLPENIADILPSTARQLETAKSQILELFRTHGYELVSPPLIEYIDSLLSDDDAALDLKTFRLDDHLSGRQLGVRADITPQVARIDAHLLGQRQGVTRLCYAGSVLHARPDSLMASREPLQIGAELYGYSGISADLEIIHLMLEVLARVGIDDAVLAVGHMGVFYALAAAASLTRERVQEILPLLQAKDRSSLREVLKEVAEPYRSAFLRLPDLFGPDALVSARRDLPSLPSLQKALDDLERVGSTLSEHRVEVYYDLTELRGTHYHTGLIFAAYTEGWAGELARGGRYDNVGHRFGRARPATGFSLDLRHVVGIVPVAESAHGICVSAADAVEAADVIRALRGQGEVVVIDYLNEGARALRCHRVLVKQAGQFVPVVVV